MIDQPGDWTIDEPWVDIGSCHSYDPAIFFPPAGGDERTPLTICGGCAVRTECLDYAVRHNERWGVWGATTQRSRRRMIQVASRQTA